MPLNWPTSQLREIADVRVSNVDKKSYATERPITLCNYMDVYANDYLTSALLDFMPATASPSEIERFALHAGDVVITKDSETPDDIGVPAVIVEDIDGLVCGYHLALIRPKASVHPTFLAKQLASAPTIRYFAANATGSTRFGLAIGTIEKLDVPTPPIAEQSKIAEVLSAVDRAIKQNETLIAKQQRIKTGLLQDLLTRGIDEHGNLRSEQTHRFKDSPLGRIPIEWECKELSQVLVQRPRNGLYKPALLIGRGTLLVGQTSFTQDRRLDFSLCRRAVVSPLEIETFGLVFGDILVTRVFATVDGVGQPVIVDSPPEPAVYESNMLLLRPADSIIDSLLLFTWLRSAATRRRIVCSVNASNQVSVNQTVLNSLPVPVPSISEQKRISQALGQIDAAVRCTDVSLLKLRLLKTGLMQDLLTGERRVTALLGSPRELVDA